jgi:uncharacterized membrane protein YedE/YeeE
MSVTGDFRLSAKTPAPPVRPGPDWRIAGLALVLLIGGAAYIGGAVGGKQAVLYALGASLGLVLFHAAFGFASTWRVFLADGRGAGLRAQMLMLALATVIFLPVLAQGTFFGQPVRGALAPFGVSVLVGAFLFGMGMQLGGGCASGTLYTVGGGSARMVVTLIFFIVGSLLGTAQMPWWQQTPNLGTLSLLDLLGLPGALAAQLGLLALIAAVTIVVEKRRHGRLSHGGAGLPGTGGGTGLAARMWRGPWPLLIGAVALALLNAATLALAGHPWTVSFGYALWGAKAAATLGVDVASWEFWTWPYPRQSLAGSLFAETTSVMNFGIIAGAFLAAGLAGKFGPLSRLDWGSITAAAVGGVLMGYGARLAFGCNVGAFFSGVASGSLHGWLWFIAAFAGTYVGTALRPRFGLLVERRHAAMA